MCLQIATIGLAASTDVVGVSLGGILGHAICTGAAVMGGRQLSAHIDERMLSILGGLLFIAFGLHAVWEVTPPLSRPLQAKVFNAIVNASVSIFMLTKVGRQDYGIKRMSHAGRTSLRAAEEEDAR